MQDILVALKNALNGVLNTLMSNKKILLMGGIALAAALVVVALIIVHVRAKKNRADLRAQLAHQMERVEVRKNKILKLRGVISLLLQENAEQQKIIENMADQEERQQYFGRITDTVARIYRQINPKDEAEIQKYNSEFCLLTEQIAHSLDVSNRTDLPWNRKIEEPAAEAPKIDHGGAGKRVLIVDDNRSAGSVLARIFETNGYYVERAESGEEALEMFLHSPEGYYAFVFMDIVLKGMNGYDTAREIRRSYRSDSESLPIIAMTANNFPEDLISIQNAGMNERLLKPITEDKVIALVKKWAGAEEVHAAPVKRAEEDREDPAPNPAKDETIDDTWKSLTFQKPEMNNISAIR